VDFQCLDSRCAASGRELERLVVVRGNRPDGHVDSAGVGEDFYRGAVQQDLELDRAVDRFQRGGLALARQFLLRKVVDDQASILAEIIARAVEIV
jgi:hypothetical protein